MQFFSSLGSRSMRPNVRVDAAARFHSSIAGPIMMRNTLPPLASNDLLCCALGDFTHSVWSDGRVHPPCLLKHVVRQIFRLSGRVEPFNIPGTPERNMYVALR